MQQDAFDALKYVMTKAPVLAIADPFKDFSLHTDASNLAIAGVLSQEQSDGTFRPIVYQSRKLVPAEINYPNHDEELLAIVYSIKVWRHNCLGCYFYHTYGVSPPFPPSTTSELK